MKKIFAISLIVISIFSTFSLYSFASSPYDKIPNNDGTQVKQYSSTANIKDIAATDNSIIVNRDGVLEELSSVDFSLIRTGKVTGLENIDYVGGNFGLIGSDNETKRIYFNCMTTNTSYIPYPNTTVNITTIYAINGRIKMETGASGQLEPTLYIDINTANKFYGYIIYEYKYNSQLGTMTCVKSYTTSYYERCDFAYVDATKIVGITGQYWPVFYTKSEINTAITKETVIPAGCNCHGYTPWGSSSIAVINPQKLAYGNGNYYAIVGQQNTTDIIRIPGDKLKF